MRDTEPNGLDRRRQRALEALLLAQSVERASEASGVSERSIWRYLQEPTFKAALRASRAASLKQAETLLATASAAAVVRLTELAMDDGPYAFAASRAVLDLAFRAAEVGDVLDRLDALEEHASAPRLRAVPRRPPA